MAEKLELIFRVVEEKAGFKGRMRLVVKTGVPKSVASQMPDDPELVNKFMRAASEILSHDISDFLALR
jgi:hypothetical protein